MKKTISIIAAAILAFGITAGAAENMTLETATQYALENSSSYKAKAAEVKADEFNARIAEKTYKNYHDSKSALSSMSISSFDMYLVRLGYVKDATDMQLRVAERASKTAEYDLKTEVKNMFYTYLNTVEKVRIAQDSLNTAEERLVESIEKKKQGTISELEQKTFENAVLQAKNTLSQAKRNQDMALLSLKNTIGYSLTEDLAVSGSFERNTEAVLKPTEVIARLDQNPNVQTLNESLALAEERCTLAKRWYFSRENGYWAEEYTYEKAQHEYESNMESMKLGIYKMYDGLVTIDENITALESGLELMTKNVEAAKLQYDLGMITANDYISQIQNYDSTKNQLVDLELTEWLTKLQYKSFYTFEQ